MDGTPHSLEKIDFKNVNLNKDTYENQKERVKRSTSGWNGYYLGDIWKSRPSSDTAENGNHHTYPPSEVLFLKFRVLSLIILLLISN